MAHIGDVRVVAVPHAQPAPPDIEDLINRLDADDTKDAAKAALKDKGIDVEKMAIYRMDGANVDKKSGMDIKILVGKSGSEQKEVKHDVYLPKASAQARLLYSQQQMIFGQLKDNAKAAYKVVTEYKSKGNELVFDSMKVTNQRPREGIVECLKDSWSNKSFSPSETFGCLKNSFKNRFSLTDTFKEEDFRKEAGKTLVFQQQEAQMKVIAKSRGITSESLVHVHKNGIKNTFNTPEKRKAFHYLAVYVPKDKRASPQLKDLIKELNSLRPKPEGTQPWAASWDAAIDKNFDAKKMEKILALYDACKDVGAEAWDPMEASDKDGEVLSEAKSNAFAAKLDDYLDRVTAFVHSTKDEYKEFKTALAADPESADTLAKGQLLHNKIQAQPHSDQIILPKYTAWRTVHPLPVAAPAGGAGGGGGAAVI